jgi:hypothetical protein
MTTISASIYFELGQKFIELMRESTFHNIHKIFTSHSFFIRLTWLLICIASYSYCSVCIVRNVVDYFDYPTVSNFETIYENEPLFPRIAICNINRTLFNDSLCNFNAMPCQFVLKREGNYQNCIEFNPGPNANVSILRAKQTGVEGGLSIGLFANDFYNGIEVYIFNHSQNLVKRSLLISPGMRTSLVVRRVFEERLGPPFSNCKTYESVIDKATNKKFRYFQTECFGLCRKRKVLEKCGFGKEFSAVTDKFYTDVEVFDAVTTNLTKICDHSLIDEVIQNFNEVGDTKICYEMCPAECSAINYELSAYDFRLPDSDYEKKFLRLNIYYETFYYTIMKQLPKTSIDTMFGTIGGLIGFECF